MTSFFLFFFFWMLILPTFGKIRVHGESLGGRGARQMVSFSVIGVENVDWFVRDDVMERRKKKRPSLAPKK